jgi:DNA-3-methyladenine glycosylase
MSPSSLILAESFYARPTLEVARDLVGAVLIAGQGNQTVTGRIVEVEAYLGAGDPASHAANGPTRRSAIMFGPPGVAYVYLIYGMHHCLNVVTEREGRAGAVLIRALEPLRGVEVMAGRRRVRLAARRQAGARVRRAAYRQLCNGPGKLCQALGIDLRWNGLPFKSRRARGRRLWLIPPAAPVASLVATPRVGIRVATAAPYRFVDADSDCLSRPVVAPAAPT